MEQENFISSEVSQAQKTTGFLFGKIENMSRKRQRNHLKFTEILVKWRRVSGYWEKWQFLLHYCFYHSSWDFNHFNYFGIFFPSIYSQKKDIASFLKLHDLLNFIPTLRSVHILPFVDYVLMITFLCLLCYLESLGIHQADIWVGICQGVLNKSPGDLLVYFYNFSLRFNLPVTQISSPISNLINMGKYDSKHI
jgi:hypothetical protein